ncbi:MAG TPA: LCP family protein [Nitrolancea sp.]|nr:LCP family protein [Nitrolancea sp.]
MTRRYPQKKRPYNRYRRTNRGDAAAPAAESMSSDSSPSLDLSASTASVDEHTLPELVPIVEASLPESLTVATKRRRWTMKKVVLIAVPILVLSVAAAFIVPVLLAAHTAYSQIFVTPMPHLHVVLNAQGTPVIETGATTPSPTPMAVSTSTSPSGASASTPVAVATPNPIANLPNWDGTSRVNILLLGSDSRGAGEVARSDTMILVTINPETKQVSMLSIPRDLLVTIPNYGQDKINAAFAYGSQTSFTGPGLAVATVEYNFGVTIDYFAEVDTFGLASIIDTVGGVTLDVAAPIKDDEYPGAGNNYLRVMIHTGLQHMNGVAAVQFARTRHDDNDFARSDRQQQLLRALQQQGVKLNLLSKATQLLTELGNTFRTDLSPTQVLALAKLASNVSAGDIHSYDMLNATTVSFLPGEPYYLIPDWTAIHQILDQMMSR